MVLFKNMLVFLPQVTISITFMSCSNFEKVCQVYSIIHFKRPLVHLKPILNVQSWTLRIRSKELGWIKMRWDVKEKTSFFPPHSFLWSLSSFCSKQVPTLLVLKLKAFTSDLGTWSKISTNVTEWIEPPRCHATTTEERKVVALWCTRLHTMAKVRFIFISRTRIVKFC